ncbi:MAG: Rieske 2Fe-2S domain-containing protein [Dehalococcoidales bacterium]|nr:Rieske 2Fe-2S domain-containing protein [Dehalococcoidales bacterium]
MADFIVIGKTGELADGTIKEISVHGENILLAFTGGRYYAATSRCTHAGGNLAKGKLEGTVVTCPVHGSRFDLKDGSVVHWWIKSALGKILRSPKPLSTYEVKIEGNNILVGIP